MQSKTKKVDPPRFSDNPKYPLIWPNPKDPPGFPTTVHLWLSIMRSKLENFDLFYMSVENLK